MSEQESERELEPDLDLPDDAAEAVKGGAPDDGAEGEGEEVQV